MIIVDSVAGVISPILGGQQIHGTVHHSVIVCFACFYGHNSIQELAAMGNLKVCLINNIVYRF